MSVIPPGRSLLCSVYPNGSWDQTGESHQPLFVSATAGIALCVISLLGSSTAHTAIYAEAEPPLDATRVSPPRSDISVR